MKRVVIIDYGSGNLRSAHKAFERVASREDSVTVTSDPKALERATHIVLPGVGAFADCMRGLNSVSGMHAALDENILQQKKPFLGICVGMQMLFEKSYEHGVHTGLSWIPGEVVKISPQAKENSAALKIPHMGWNDLQVNALKHPLLDGIHSGAHAYFVHSYHAQCPPEYILATADYGGPITSVVAKGNIMGTQFHPEKSQETGLKLIGNFLKL